MINTFRKKLFVTLVSVILLFSFVINTSALSEEFSWYIKKRGNNRPIFPTGAEKAAELGAYYIDENYPDDRAEKKLYLTFDAGYENGNVERILDTLLKENVPAAFFLLDNIIVKNPDLVKRMENEGHTVSNHTKRHRNLCNKTKDEIAADLSELEDICFKETGVVMKKYFRFPEGKYSIEALKTVNELGYKTIFWSLAYDDWDNSRQMSPERAKKKILDNTHNGAIILLHPTSKTNADILGDLITSWRKMGYVFGSLDEL